MNFIIEKLKQKDFENWNMFVKENNLTIFHTIEWKKIIEETFGFNPIYYIIKDKNEIVGIAPAFVCRNFLKKMLVSMPFFEYGGPFIKEDYKKAYEDVFNKYKDLVENGEVDYVKIRSLPFDADYGDIGFNKELEAYDFYIDIEGKKFDDVWNSFTNDSGVRTAVNKSKKKEIKVKTKNNPKVIYNMILKKDARLGSPSFSKRFYTNIDKYLGDKTNYATSYLEGKPIASMIALQFGDELLLHQMGSDPKYFKKSSTDILFIEQIKYAIENGLKKVDFGRSKPDSSHSFFKKKYQCEKRDIYAYYYPKGFSENRYSGREKGQRLIKMIPWLFTRTFLGHWIRKNLGL